MDPPLRSRFQAREVSAFSLPTQYESLQAGAPNVHPDLIRRLLSLGEALRAIEASGISSFTFFILFYFILIFICYFFIVILFFISLLCFIYLFIYFVLHRIDAQRASFLRNCVVECYQGVEPFPTS